MEKLLQSIEDSFQMEGKTEEDQFRRRICCSNIEYYLRINNIYGMSGSRSEIWAEDFSKRNYWNKVSEERKEA